MFIKNGIVGGSLKVLNKLTAAILEVEELLLQSPLDIAQGGTGADNAQNAAVNLNVLSLSGGTVTGATIFNSTVKIGNAVLSYDTTADALKITFI